MKLLIRSQTSMVVPLKFGNGWAISFHTLLGKWLLIHAGIKVNSCWYKGSWDPVQTNSGYSGRRGDNKGVKMIFKITITSHRGNVRRLKRFCTSEVTEGYRRTFKLIVVWWHHRTGSALGQKMACCLMVPSHYLNRCWPTIPQVPKSIIIRGFEDTNQWIKIENCIFINRTQIFQRPMS